MLFRSGEASGAEPLPEVLLFGPEGEDELTWCVEGARDAEFAIVLAPFWAKWGGVSVAGDQWGILLVMFSS